MQSRGMEVDTEQIYLFLPPNSMLFVQILKHCVQVGDLTVIINM